MTNVNCYIHVRVFLFNALRISRANLACALTLVGQHDPKVALPSPGHSCRDLHIRGREFVCGAYSSRLHPTDQVAFMQLARKSVGELAEVRIAQMMFTPTRYREEDADHDAAAHNVFADYLKLGAPQTLTREQVRASAEKNNGAPIEKNRIHISSGKAFSRLIPMRENDVYAITLER